MLWRQPQIFEGSSLYFCSVFQLRLSILSILSLNHSFLRPLPSAHCTDSEPPGSPSLGAFLPAPLNEPLIRFPKWEGVPQRSSGCPRHNEEILYEEPYTCRGHLHCSLAHQWGGGHLRWVTLSVLLHQTREGPQISTAWIPILWNCLSSWLGQIKVATLSWNESGRKALLCSCLREHSAEAISGPWHHPLVSSTPGQLDTQLTHVQNWSTEKAWESIVGNQVHQP